MYLSNKYHTPLILSPLSLRPRFLKILRWYSSQTWGAVEIVGFENRDGDSPLRGITATPLSEELRGELSSPPVIRSEDVSHGPEEELSEGEGGRRTPMAWLSRGDKDVTETWNKTLKKSNFKLLKSGYAI